MTCTSQASFGYRSENEKTTTEDQWSCKGSTEIWDMRPQLTLPYNRSRSSGGHDYTNFVELHSLMLQAKFQNHRSYGSEE